MGRKRKSDELLEAQGNEQERRCSIEASILSHLADVDRDAPASRVHLVEWWVYLREELDDHERHILDDEDLIRAPTEVDEVTT
jgi:hypothetical protein